MTSAQTCCAKYRHNYRLNSVWLQVNRKQKFGHISTGSTKKIFSKKLQFSDLNLSKNEIYKLPDEFAEMKELVRLDVSHNYLLNLPSVLFRIPKLRQLRANHNAIIGMLEHITFSLQRLISFFVSKTFLSFSHYQTLKVIK